MNFKRILAFTMAATMVVGSSLTAFAGDPTFNGTQTADVGTAIGTVGTGTSAYVDKNVMSVVVPTANFDYKIDPEGVMSEVKSYDGTAVESVTDTTGLVFLNTSSDGKKTVSNYSDALTITNKSAIPVNIGVTYYVEDGSSTAANNITVASDLSAKKDLSDKKAIYLGLIAVGLDDEKPFTATNTTKADYTLLSAEKAYKVTDTNGVYSYAIDGSYAGEFPKIDFYVTGAINKDLAMSTWYYDDNNVRKPKVAPKLNFKYTLTGVRDSLPLSVVFGGDDLYIAKTSDGWATGGGFAAFATTAVSAITINGRTVTPASTHVKKLEGDQYTTSYVVIPFADIAGVFGVASSDVSKLTEEQKATIKGYVKAVSVTQGNTYYGEVE